MQASDWYLIINDIGALLEQLTSIMVKKEVSLAPLVITLLSKDQLEVTLICLMAPIPSAGCRILEILVEGSPC